MDIVNIIKNKYNINNDIEYDINFDNTKKYNLIYISDKYKLNETINNLMDNLEYGGFIICQNCNINNKDWCIIRKYNFTNSYTINDTGILRYNTKTKTITKIENWNYELNENLNLQDMNYMNNDIIHYLYNNLDYEILPKSEVIQIINKNIISYGSNHDTLPTICLRVGYPYTHGHLILDSLFPFYVFMEKYKLLDKKFNILIHEFATNHIETVNDIQKYNKLVSIISDIFKPINIYEMNKNNNMIFYNFINFNNDVVFVSYISDYPNMYNCIYNTEKNKFIYNNIDKNVNNYCNYIIKQYNVPKYELDEQYIYIIHHTFRGIKNIALYIAKPNIIYVDFEKYSFKEQITLMYNAKNVISPYGSPLTNCIFMRENTNVIIYWHYYAKYFFRNIPLHHVSLLCRKIIVSDYEKKYYDDNDTYFQMTDFNKEYFKKNNNHLEVINPSAIKQHTMTCMYDILNVLINLNLNDIINIFNKKKHIDTLYIHKIKRYDIINLLIQKYNFKSYLEIGYGFGETYKNIKCEMKHAIDLFVNNSDITFNMSSNDAFNIITQKYDIIFIDGDHNENQVYIDIQNSLNHLNENGIIVCHDMIPPTEEHSICPRITKKGEGWTGNCYLALIHLRTKYNYFVQTVDTDWGCGIIIPHLIGEKIIDTNYRDWNYFNENKIKLLNIISCDEFLELYKL